MRDPNDRNKNARKSLLITDIPAALRAALVADAKQQDSSINETAVRILCAAYRVKHVAAVNGLRGQDGPVGFTAGEVSGNTMLIRGGAALHRALDKDARKRGGTLRGVVLEGLSNFYGLEPEPIARRPRTTKGKA